MKQKVKEYSPVILNSNDRHNREQSYEDIMDFYNSHIIKMQVNASLQINGSERIFMMHIKAIMDV